MLDYLHATLTQAILFPGLGIARHVNHRLETKCRRDHADGQAKVAGAADGDRMTCEHSARRFRGELAPIAIVAD